MRGAIRAIRASALAALLGAASCATTQGPRILLIGLDGADWDILDPLVAQGRLPNLERLERNGVRGPLRTLERLPLSPVIWTSIATGRGPEAHGVTWFLVDTPEGRRVPVQSNHRRVRALWNILAQEERRAGVVGWWATAPAEEIGAGVVVSDALGYHGFGRGNFALTDAQTVFPAGRAAEFAALVPPLTSVDAAFAQRFIHVSAEEFEAAGYSPVRDAAPDPGSPIHLFQEAASTTLGYTAIARRLLEGPRFDLFLVYYESTDSLAHLFMKDAPPKLPWVSDQEFARYRDVVDSWYVFIDEKIGELLASAPAGTSVVVVSDHGFRTGADRPRSETAVDLRGAHLDHDPDGIFLASGPLFRSGATVRGATVLDVAPTLLFALGLKVGRDMEGRVLGEVFAPAVSERRPVEFVATWEKGAAAGPAPAAGAGTAAAGFDDEAATRQLRMLGYVSEEDAQRPVPRPEVGSESGAEAPPSSPEQHLNLGRLHLQNGKLDLALEEFRAALTGTARDADALTEIGVVALARGEREKALESFVAALQWNPDHRRALLRLADLRVARGELRDAEAIYKQVLAGDDRLPEAWVSLGDVLARQGRSDDAASVLEHAVELDPRDVVARYDLGVVRMQQERWDEARAAYLRVLELAPDHPLALNNLGTVHLRQGDRARAMECYRRVATTNSRHVESRVNLGSLLLEEGAPDDALVWLEQAVALDPGLEPAQYLLAKALLAKGDLAAARRRFEALVRIFPANAPACVELARISLREGKSDELAAWLRHAKARGAPNLRAALDADPEFREVDLDTILGK